MEADCELVVPASSLRRRDYSGEESCCCPGESKGKDKKDGPKWVEPEAGDPVDFHVRGTVVSVDGGHAKVHVAFVNDKRPEKPVEEKKPTPDEETARAGAKLRNQGNKEYV